jgi:hypothetical protein
MADEPVRFPAQLPYDKWPSVNGVFDLMRNGLWTEARHYFNTPPNGQNITDAIGAGDYWRQQYNPTPPPATIIKVPFGTYPNRWPIENFVDQVYAFEVTMAANPFAVSGQTTIYEYGGGGTWQRYMTVSLTPGDFRPVDPTGANGPLAESVGLQATILWNVGPGATVDLKPGTTYYFNVKNLNPDGVNHQAQVEILWPHN